jgi:hypothetical protein
MARASLRARALTRLQMRSALGARVLYRARKEASQLRVWEGVWWWGGRGEGGADAPTNARPHALLPSPPWRRLARIALYGRPMILRLAPRKIGHIKNEIGPRFGTAKRSCIRDHGFLDTRK